MRQVQQLASKNRRMSVASIALAVAEVKGQLVSAQTIRHTVQQVSLHQERSQKGDSGCASEKLGVPHLLSD